jgi:hypothetical protein
MAVLPVARAGHLAKDLARFHLGATDLAIPPERLRLAEDGAYGPKTADAVAR